MPDKLLNAKEVAAMLRVSEWGVYKLAQRFQIPCVHIGSRVRFSMLEIEAYLKRRTTGKSYIEADEKETAA
jgi:excisionase family DNA binding protein